MKRILLQTAILFQVLATAGAQQSLLEDAEKLRLQRQARQQQELLRRQDERSSPGRRFRVLNSNATGLSEIVKSAPPVRTESCLAQAMPPDRGVDLQKIPLAEWLNDNDKEQIPWRVEVGRPDLRFDQRYEVGYWGSIEVKDLDWPEDGLALEFITAISGSDGEWIIPPNTGRQVYERRSKAEPRILFGDCLFLRPGDYNLVFAVFDSHSGKHSLMQRRIRRDDFSEELLPSLDSKLPTVSFPQADDAFIDNPETPPPSLVLSVANKQPLEIELISPLNFPAEWVERPDFIRSTTNRLIAGIAVLSQLKLENSSISATVVDLVNRETLFEQPSLLELEWKRLVDAFPKLAETNRLSLKAIETRKDRAAFFRQFLQKRLEGPRERTRVLIILSGSVLFEGGSDLTPVSTEGNCRCRVYHLHFQETATISFNDVEKLLRGLRPRTFDLESARDFRKALADIISNLESL